MASPETLGFKPSALATAIIKFAPDLAKELADRWESATEWEAKALDEFLAFLRATPSAGGHET